MDNAILFWHTYTRDVPDLNDKPKRLIVLIVDIIKRYIKNKYSLYLPRRTFELLSSFGEAVTNFWFSVIMVNFYQVCPHLPENS